MAKTNSEIIEGIIQKYPQFQGHAAQMARSLMTPESFDEVSRNDIGNFINDFFGAIMRVYLNVINISHAKDPLENNGFGEYFKNNYGGITQRMSIDSVKPINPGWKGLKNGDSPDPFVVRKPVTNERFYKQNFDYASLITVPDDFQFKTMFVSEYGLSEFMAGIMEGLRNGYITQKYLNKKEALNAALNGTKHPLQATQQVGIQIAGDDPTAAELTKMILTIKNVIDLMVMAPQTGAFNAGKFKSTQDKSRLKLLIRPGYMNQISVDVLTSAFNPSNLNIGVDVITISDFGGLIPYKDAAFTEQLYPVYDELGSFIGYSSTEGQIGESNVEVQEDEAFMKDPNENVIAILADKGVIFETEQTPYEVRPIFNPRGRYTNFWASSANNGIHFDSFYNFVVFNKTTA